MSGIDQKQYLKKYLGIGKRSGEKKKKKKTKKLGPNRLTIVDDDVDVLLNEQIKEDLNAAEDEDAPQIVSVIDERPPSLRIDEVSKNKLWLPIGETVDISAASVGVKFEGNIKLEGNKSQSNKLATKHLKKEKKQSECDGGDILHPSEIKKEKDEDISPPRKSTNHLSDSSPPRRIKKEQIEDISPPRKSKRSSPLRDKDRKKQSRNEDSSPPRRPKQTHQSDHNRSPPRHRDKSGRKKSRWAEDEDQTEKLKKTLDGKTAGLQNATDLVAETSQLKQKEDELFRNMSAEISGANAATVVRKKKKDVDWEEEERKRKKEAENKEKYDRWGKGLKQVGDASEKFQNELYEMSKPLARYADDEDLERHLKEQEREGDPMLDYLRKKKRKKAVKEGKPEAHVYQGDAPANRFGIRPGYRWDGVDRSNGYEKQWFEVQNARKASVEESYKWSTEDM